MCTFGFLGTSVKDLLMGEERKMPVDDFWSFFLFYQCCEFLSASTVLTGWQEKYLVCRKTVPLIPRGFSSGTESMCLFARI